MTAKQQLDSFIAKFSPEVASVARGAFVWMRKKFPHCHRARLRTHRASIRRRVSPGKQARSIRLESIEVLNSPQLLALIEAEAGRLGLQPGAGDGKIVIQSISAKQRPRRPPAKN